MNQEIEFTAWPAFPRLGQGGRRPSQITPMNPLAIEREPDESAFGEHLLVPMSFLRKSIDLAVGRLASGNRLAVRLRL